MWTFLPTGTGVKAKRFLLALDVRREKVAAWGFWRYEIGRDLEPEAPR
jgi:hypothetical protein